MGTTIAGGENSTIAGRGLSAFLGGSDRNRLVLVAQDMAHWYVGELVAGANQAASAHGYRLITLDFHRSPDREREILEAICDSQVEGCIFLWDHSPANLTLYAQIAEKCVCVQLGDPKPISHLDYITSDNFSGGLLAMQHLIALGYRQIGHVTLTPPIEAVKERSRAYFDALKEAGLAFNENWFLALPYGLLEADRVRRLPFIRAFLTQQQLPRALFICADWLASEVVECILDLGMRIPDDIALVGFDDALPYALSSVSLTTVRVDLRLSGRLAVERVLYRIQKGIDQVEPCQLQTPLTLVVRASSANMTPTNERWDIVMRHIQGHYREDLSAQQVAGEFGLDANYFSHHFAQIFGKRFTDYVNQLRLQYASELLLTTDRTVDQIARSAGFHSLNHFYLLFRRSYAASPNAFRKQQTFR